MCNVCVMTMSISLTGPQVQNYPMPNALLRLAMTGIWVQWKGIPIICVRTGAVGFFS